MPVAASVRSTRAMPPGEGPADEFGLEAPILLDRAAGEQFRRAYLDMSRAARLEPENGRGVPDQIAATPWPPSTEMTAPVT